MTATIKNLITGETVKVSATTNHPCSSYGQAVWVDSDNNCLGVVGVPLLGYTIVE